MLYRRAVRHLGHPGCNDVLAGTGVFLPGLGIQVVFLRRGGSSGVNSFRRRASGLVSAHEFRNVVQSLVGEAGLGARHEVRVNCFQVSRFNLRHDDSREVVRAHGITIFRGQILVVF